MITIKFSERGLATISVVVIAVIVTAVVVGVGTYALTPKDGGAEGEVNKSDVQNYLQGASETDVRDIAQNSIPQSIIDELATPTGNGEEQVTIGWIYGGPIGTEAWTTATDDSRIWMEETYPWIETVVRESVTVEDVVDVAKSMIEDRGADIIMVNYEYVGLPLVDIAADYPDVYFMPEIVGQFEPHGGMTDVPNNVVRANGREYQSIYLSGMVAGALATNNKIGCVASMPASMNYRRINAFTLGARRVNPQAEVHIIWLGSWWDPSKEGEIARTLVEDRDVSVLWETTDSQSPVRVAAEYDIPFIGKSLDYVRAGWATDEEVAVCYEHRWEIEIMQIVKDHLAGGPPKPVRFPGMDETLYTPDGEYRSVVDLRQNDRVGVEAISPHWRDEISQDVLNEIEEMREKMINGNWDPFMQEVVDRNGDVQSAEGEMPTGEELLSMDYFVEGVIGAKE